MNINSFAFLCTGVLLNAVAQLLLKAGTNALGPLSLSTAPLWQTLWRIGTQGPIIGGLCCYVVSVVVWIFGLSRVDVSIAYPMLSLGYVLNAFLAWWLFGELLSVEKLLGIGLILLGVIVLARS